MASTRVEIKGTVSGELRALEAHREGSPVTAENLAVEWPAIYYRIKDYYRWRVLARETATWKDSSSGKSNSTSEDGGRNRTVIGRLGGWSRRFSSKPVPNGNWVIAQGAMGRVSETDVGVLFSSPRYLFATVKFSESKILSRQIEVSIKHHAFAYKYASMAFTLTLIRSYILVDLHVLAQHSMLPIDSLTSSNAHSGPDGGTFEWRTHDGMAGKFSQR